LRAYPQVYEEYDDNVMIVGGAAWQPRAANAERSEQTEKRAQR
jgi:hypothetical protein